MIRVGCCPLTLGVRFALGGGESDPSESERGELGAESGAAAAACRPRRLSDELDEAATAAAAGLALGIPENANEAAFKARLRDAAVACRRGTPAPPPAAADELDAAASGL
jgi:hypothetical protein